MLSLKQIRLTQFKNYHSQSFEFEKRIHCICGNNGVGKTNLLDAIYYLCFTKGYFAKSDAICPTVGSQGFRIEGHFEPGGEKETAVCTLRETGKKEFTINDIPYTKFSEHIGRFPCVVIAPDDTILITGSSDIRRKFFDAILCQLDKDYVKNLIAYNKILDQRNAHLKNTFNTPHKYNELLDVLDEQLAKAGTAVFEKRNSFFKPFLPAVVDQYQKITQSLIPISIAYISGLHTEGLDTLLKNNRNKDILTQRTNAGVHKDNIEIMQGNMLFKQTASQGQRKGLLFAFKLEELNLIKLTKGFAPILLLDDVFEKLDDEKIINLLTMVCAESSSQIFITDTNPKRLAGYLNPINVDYAEILLT